MRGREFRSWRVASRRDGDGHDGLTSIDAAIASQALSNEGKTALLEIARRKHLTGRGIVRLSRVARAIADMAESQTIEPVHLMEASLLQGRRGDGEAC